MDLQNAINEIVAILENYRKSATFENRLDEWLDKYANLSTEPPKESL